MDSQTVPSEVNRLLQEAEDLPLAELAGKAAVMVATLQGAETQSQAGFAVLTHLRPRCDEGQRDLVDRALEVMHKFPHFPRPRAAVLMKALKKLAGQ